MIPDDGEVCGWVTRFRDPDGQNNRDAWFIGYTPNYTAGVWIGNDDNTPMSNASYGGTIPAKIFKTLMTYVIVH